MISLCMIVKNEQEYLAQCLESVKGLVDEIIIVDTGSTDKTVEIAKSFGAKVVFYKWDNDTADARNTGLKQATQEWILVLDADEVIAKKDHKGIKELLRKTEFDAFYLVQLNYSNGQSDLRWVPTNNPESRGFKGFYPIEIIRLFRNKKDFLFTSIVHERMNESIEKANGKIARTDIPVHHYQHIKGDEELKRKQLKFLDLFEKKVKEYPGDPKLYHDMALILFNFKKDVEAAEKAFKKAVEIKPDYFEALFSLATLYLKKGEKEKAIEFYKKTIRVNPEHAASYYNLANIFVSDKKFNEAKKLYQAAGRLNTLNPNVFNNLGNVFVVLKDYKRAVLSYKRAVALNHARKDEIIKNIQKIERMLNEK